MSGVFASTRDFSTVFVALDGWRAGRKPYLVKTPIAAERFANIAGDLPDRHDMWSMIQISEGNLLFAGTEFGVFVSVDGGQKWVHLKGGMPVAQARDMTVQKREGDLVVATFGRGFYVLDDYSPLRELAAASETSPLSDVAHLYPLRDAYLFNQTGLAPAGTAGIGPMSGNWTAPNPPFGAVFTYSVNGGVGADEKLVLTIADDAGKQIRRLDLDKSPGLRRFTWNLRTDAPPPGTAGAQQGFGAFGRGGLQGTLVPAAASRSDQSVRRLPHADRPAGLTFGVLPEGLKITRAARPSARVPASCRDAMADGGDRPQPGARHRSECRGLQRRRRAAVPSRRRRGRTGHARRHLHQSGQRRNLRSLFVCGLHLDCDVDRVERRIRRRGGDRRSRGPGRPRR